MDCWVGEEGTQESWWRECREVGGECEGVEKGGEGLGGQSCGGVVVETEEYHFVDIVGVGGDGKSLWETLITFFFWFLSGFFLMEWS